MFKKLILVAWSIKSGEVFNADTYHISLFKFPRNKFVYSVKLMLNVAIQYSMIRTLKVDTILQIVMEYCGAGSVSDIMRLRKKTLIEDEISTILSDTLKGLEYLHLRRKIHRDIKAGNILLNSEGHAKLADFGVAGQLTVSVLCICAIVIFNGMFDNY